MSRTIFLSAASVIVLGACQPSDNTSASLEAETPPVAATDAEIQEADHDAHDGDAHDAEADHHEDGEDHAEDHHDDHDDEAHAEDDHNDHDDHDDHAHDDDDHAGGEAHVHGVSELAASIDGTSLSISIEGALANFDLDETLRTLDDATPYTDGVVTVIGGDCKRDSANAEIRPIGDHGNLVVDLTYTCGTIADVAAIEVTGFQSFAGFEEVNAVFLTDTRQVAETLTESDTRLDIN